MAVLQLLKTLLGSKDSSQERDDIFKGKTLKVYRCHVDFDDLPFMVCDDTYKYPIGKIIDTAHTNNSETPESISGEMRFRMNKPNGDYLYSFSFHELCTLKDHGHLMKITSQKNRLKFIIFRII